MEPDISSYIVCSNISDECTTINVTEAGGDSSDLRQYKFLNLRAKINFTVTAMNIVGNGESTSVLTKACKYDEELNGTFSDQSLQTVVFFDSESRPSLSVKVIVSILATYNPTSVVKFILHQLLRRCHGEQSMILYVGILNM